MVDRSLDMWLVAYFLARCGHVVEGGPSTPPPQLGVEPWSRTDTVFISALGNGRSLRTFANSLKRARDGFDSHLESGRAGRRSS